MLYRSLGLASTVEHCQDKKGSALRVGSQEFTRRLILSRTFWDSVLNSFSSAYLQRTKSSYTTSLFWIVLGCIVHFFVWYRVYTYVSFLPEVITVQSRYYLDLQGRIYTCYNCLHKQVLPRSIYKIGYKVLYMFDSVQLT